MEAQARSLEEALTMKFENLETELLDCANIKQTKWSQDVDKATTIVFFA